MEAFATLLGRPAIGARSSTSRASTENQEQFLKTAVAFEDLAVAAYKGQAPRSSRTISRRQRSIRLGRGPARRLDALPRGLPAGDGVRRAKSRAGVTRIVDSTNFVAAPGKTSARAPRIHGLIIAPRHETGLAVVLVLGVGTVAIGALSGPPARRRCRSDLPAAPDPAFVVPKPKPLRAAATFLLGPRCGGGRRPEGPEASSAVVARSASDPEGTTNMLSVLGRTRDGRKTVDRARLPGLPTGATAGCRGSALSGYEFVARS